LTVRRRQFNGNLPERITSIQAGAREPERLLAAGRTESRRQFPRRRMSSTHRAEDWVGRIAVRNVRVSAEMVDRFASLSGDYSPIHMSDAAAQQRGFAARVVHGMLLASLVSEVIGMELPGEAGVIQDTQFAFRKPCHPGDEITIEVQVSEFFESVQTLVLKVKITSADGIVLMTGQVKSGLRQLAS
jgi:3-hydroxybutyryl-CoA dehydratase